MTRVKKINYNGRVFRPMKTSATGEADPDTVFRYFQDGDIVWADYSGGAVKAGHLIATVDAEGNLDMRYHHFNSSGELMTGICRSTPEVLADGRLLMHEKWQWTSGDMSTGESQLEEILPA